MASCWTYRHADGQQGERRRHVDLVEPSRLITDPRGVGDRENPGCVKYLLRERRQRGVKTAGGGLAR